MKLNTLVVNTNKLIKHFYFPPQKKSKISRPCIKPLLFRLLMCNTFTRLLPEGRAGVAWEPSNTVMFYFPSPDSPPEIKFPLTSLMVLHFIYFYNSCISTSLSATHFKQKTILFPWHIISQTNTVFTGHFVLFI